jgi:hypothetical protein
MRKISIPILIVILALVGFNAGAAEVGGVLSAPAGQVAGRQLHFESRTTRDIFMARTDNQGRFEAELPPGNYALRGESGTIFVPEIVIAGLEPVNLGTVNQPTGFNPFRIFQMEDVVEVLVHTPAPSTAYVMSQAAGIRTTVPIPPVSGASSQKGGAGGMPSSAPSAPVSTAIDSQLTPVPPR